MVVGRKIASAAVLGFFLSYLIFIWGMGKSSCQASSKPVLDEKTITTAVGKKEYLYIRYGKTGASYTFTSSNKKIAVVKGLGTYAQVTGSGYGTCNIKVKEKYKGKTVTVGSCKFTVKKTKIKERTQEELTFGIGRNKDPDFSLMNGWFLDYINRRANYQFISLNPEILSIQKTGQIIETKMAGAAKVEVKETFASAKRSLGAFYLYVSEPKIITAYEGKQFKVNDYIYLNDFVAYSKETTVALVYDVEGNEQQGLLTKDDAGFRFYKEGDYTIKVGTRENPEEYGTFSVIVKKEGS